MPEGHTILRLAREHQKLFKGSVLRVDSPQGKFAEGAELLDGGRLIGVQAFGKHSLHRFRPFDDGPPRFDLWLHVHLGLYGKWVSGPLPLPEVVGQVRLRIWDEHHFAQLRGATVSEVLTAEAVKTLQARLGEDPLKSKDAGATSYAKVAAQHQADRAAADGSGRDGRRRQRLPGRDPVHPPDQPAPARQPGAPRSSGSCCGPT